MKVDEKMLNGIWAAAVSGVLPYLTLMLEAGKSKVQTAAGA